MDGNGRTGRAGCRRDRRQLSPRRKTHFSFCNDQKELDHEDSRDACTCPPCVCGVDQHTSYAQSPWEKPQTPPPPHERSRPPSKRISKCSMRLTSMCFSNQKRNRLHESHADDIVVTWPDGHETKGLKSI
jgi:hypothetical protein